jgi:hypothetical protein
MKLDFNQRKRGDENSDQEESDYEYDSEDYF